MYNIYMNVYRSLVALGLVALGVLTLRGLEAVLLLLLAIS